MCSPIWTVLLASETQCLFCGAEAFTGASVGAVSWEPASIRHLGQHPLSGCYMALGSPFQTQRMEGFTWNFGVLHAITFQTTGDVHGYNKTYSGTEKIHIILLVITSLHMTLVPHTWWQSWEARSEFDFNETSSEPLTSGKPWHSTKVVRLLQTQHRQRWWI